MQEMVRPFVENPDHYRYTKFGAALRVFLNIPTRRERAYYCSQFVAEILKNSGAAKLEKWAPYYLPHHLRALAETKFKFEGNLREYLYAYGILKEPVQSV